MNLTAIVPLQLLIAFLVTIPKRLGGERTIALLPTVYRFFTAMWQGELGEWDAEGAHTGVIRDTAAPQDSARREARRRQLVAEACTVLGRPYV